MRFVVPPPGVIAVALLVLAGSAYSLIYSLQNDTLNVGTAIFQALLLAFALGLLLLRPWAWWIAVVVLPFAILVAVMALLAYVSGGDSDRDDVSTRAAIVVAVGLVVAASVFAYLLSAPVKAAFAHRPEDAREFPAFPQRACLILIAAGAAVWIVLSLVVVYACLYEGECI